MKISKYIDIQEYNTKMAIMVTRIIVTSVPIIVASVWWFIPQMTIITILIIVAFAGYFIWQKRNAKRNKITPENEMKLLKMVEAEFIKRFSSEEIYDAMDKYGIPEPKLHEIPVDASAEICLGHRIRKMDSDGLIRIAGELNLNIDHLL